MQPPKALQKLAKMLDYVLGRRPDEFGLVLDEDGWVRIKDLLKAMNEEDGWGHIRRSNLNEILVSLPEPLVEIQDNRIRAVNRACLTIPDPNPAQDLPLLLYTCVRKKAHLAAVEKGVVPLGHHPKVILSSTREMAMRVGKRFDASPVLLTVHTEKARQLGIAFFQAGETLWLSDPLPPEAFEAPPLPKQKPEAEKAKKERQKTREAHRDPTPGSFVLEFEREKEKSGGNRLSQKDRKRKDMLKDKEKKRARRQKQKQHSEDFH